MTLREYLTLLRRYWISLTAVTLLIGVVGFGYSSTLPTEYESSASVLVTSELGGNGSDLLQGSTYVENLVASYVVAATSAKVLQPVIDDLGLDTTPLALSHSITADSPTNTVLINIHVRDTKPAEAARIANGVTDSLSQAVSDVSPTLSTKKPAIRLTTMQDAVAPQVPVSPNKKRWLLLSLMVGLIVGVGQAGARRTFGSAVASAADVVAVTDVPVVGEVVRAPRGATLPATVLRSSLGVQAESLRGLAANLNFLGVGAGIRSIVITSPSPSEGKSSVAASLAIVLAEAHHRVLLVDADLRKPTAHRLANLDNSVGLTSVLIGRESLSAAAQPWAIQGLSVLTSGPSAPNPSQLLNSEEMRSLVDEAWRSFDFVVIDSAPVLTVTDAVWLGHMADSVLMVVRRGKTKPRSLTKALEALVSSRTSVAGVVLNRMVRRSKQGEGYYSASPRTARRVLPTRA